MAVTVQQEVAALYSAIFNRAPDQEGLNNWVNLIQGGASLSQAAEGFVQHPVFTELYAGLTDIQFVQQLYINVLGSEGDAKGIQNWANLLASGVSKAQVVADFVSGALSVDLDAMLASGELTQAEYDAAVIRQDTLTNKADVGVYFAETFGAASNLNPATDTSTVAGLQADPAFVASQAAIANVTNDAATVTAAKGRIDVAVGTDDPAGSLVGQNSALTAALVALAEANQAVAEQADEITDFLAENDFANEAAVQNNLNTTSGLASATLNTAKGVLADKQASLVTANQNLTAAQAKVDGITDLNKALNAQAAEDEASDAADEAAAVALTAIAAATAAADVVESGALYDPSVLSGALVTVDDAGTDVAIITISSEGVIAIAADYKTEPGIQAVLDAAKAAYAAEVAKTSADAVYAAAQAANTSTLKGIVLANTADVTALTNAKTAVSDLNEEISDLTDAIAAVEALAVLTAERTELTTAAAAAAEAVEELGYNVVDYAAGTLTLTGSENDVVVVATNDGTVDASIAANGFENGDLLFIGTGYKFGGATSDTVTTQDALLAGGNTSALEVFFQQSGSDTIVHIETKAFANGAADPANDLVSITLTGVTAADLVFENGFVSFA